MRVEFASSHGDGCPDCFRIGHEILEIMERKDNVDAWYTVEDSHVVTAKRIRP